MSLEHDLETHVADALGGSVAVEEVTVTPAGTWKSTSCE